MSYPPPQPAGYPMPYHPGQLDGQARPNGGTAITAGVLAILGGLWGLIQLFTSIGLVGASDDPEAHLPSGFATYAILSLVANIIIVLALIIGGILLFVRKRIGQWLVTGGCVVVVLLYIGSVVALSGTISAAEERYGSSTSGLLGGSIALFVIAAIPALVTLVLVLITPTTRYLTWMPGEGASYPGQQYPNPGGYPGTGGYPNTGGYPGTGGYPNTGGYPQQQPPQQWGQTPPQW